LLGLMDEQLNQQDGNIQSLQQTMYTADTAEEELKKLYAYVDQRVAQVEV
jgi:hypothetical protein